MPPWFTTRQQRICHESSWRKSGRVVPGGWNLSAIAATQPHAAYSAYTHGLFGKWTYWLQTCADIESLLVPLEESLSIKFIPSLTSRPPWNDSERDILAPPPRLGGLGLEVLLRRVLSFKKYSKTSNNGPSEKRTTSLQRTAHLPPIDFTIELIHFKPPRSGHLSTPNNGHWSVPNVP